MSIFLENTDTCFFRCRFCVWDDDRKMPVCKLMQSPLVKSKGIPDWCPEKMGMIAKSDIYCEKETEHESY